MIVLYRFELDRGRYELSFEVSIPEEYDSVEKTVGKWRKRFAHTTVVGTVPDPSPPEGETFESGVDVDPEATRG